MAQPCTGTLNPVKSPVQQKLGENAAHMGQARKTEAGQRYAALVKELADEYTRSGNGDRGVGARIASKLKMDAGVVSKIRGDAYEPGDIDASTIERVCTRLKMRAAYFFDRWPEPRSYRDYLLSSPEPQDQAMQLPDDAAANAAILEMLGTMGERVTPEELQELRAVPGLASGAKTVQEAAHRFARYLAGMRSARRR